MVLSVLCFTLKWFRNDNEKVLFVDLSTFYKCGPICALRDSKVFHFITLHAIVILSRLCSVISIQKKPLLHCKICLNRFLNCRLITPYITGLQAEFNIASQVVIAKNSSGHEQPSNKRQNIPIK